MKKKSRTILSRRRALDRVLAAVKREAGPDLCPYDIACWILYACDRYDSKLFLSGNAEGLHPGEEEFDYAQTATMEDELKEKRALWNDDSDAVYQLIDTQEMLAKRYDRGYRRPVLRQDDWL
jgi:hypothetical protein